jgi:hypothetical protein
MVGGTCFEWAFDRALSFRLLFSVSLPQLSLSLSPSTEPSIPLFQPPSVITLPGTPSRLLPDHLGYPPPSQLFLQSTLHSLKILRQLPPSLLVRFQPETPTKLGTRSHFLPNSVIGNKIEPSFKYTYNIN